jgi:uncharacterized membrane protein
MSKCNEIYIVVYWEHILATVIFVDFTVPFWYMFMKPPYYPNKLRNVLK